MGVGCYSSLGLYAAYSTSNLLVGDLALGTVSVELIGATVAKVGATVANGDSTVSDADNERTQRRIQRRT